MYVGTQRGQKRITDLLGLEVLAAVSHLPWVLGPALRSSDE